MQTAVTAHDGDRVCLYHKKCQIVSTCPPLPTLPSPWANALAVVRFGSGRCTQAGVQSVRREGLSLKFLKAASCPTSKECCIVQEHRVGLQTLLGLDGRSLCFLLGRAACPVCGHYGAAPLGFLESEDVLDGTQWSFARNWKPATVRFSCMWRRGCV